MRHIGIVLALTMSCTSGSWAQVAAATGAEQPATKAVASRPVIDPAVALSGAALLKTLREGGNVLFMRHAQAGTTAPECPGEDMLTPAGETQARRVGEAIGRLRIPVASVQSSVTCRTRQSATLLGLGAVALNPDLNPSWMRRNVELYAQRFNYLLVAPAVGSNTVLVSHVQGSKVAAESILIDLAEIVVYRGVAEGRALAVARIKLDEWAALLAVDGQRP